MPNYKGHLCGGFVVYLCIMLVFVTFKPSFVTSFEWLLFTLAGALFPDVDIKSKGQKYFYYGVFVLFLLLAFQGCFHHIACFSFLVMTPMLARHRGIFHSVWFVILLPIMIWIGMSFMFPLLSRALFFNALFFIAGALSHIYLDRGIKRRYPKSRNFR